MCAGLLSTRVTSRPRPAWPPVTMAFLPVKLMPTITSLAVEAAVKPLPSGCCLWVGSIERASVVVVAGPLLLLLLSVLDMVLGSDDEREPG